MTSANALFSTKVRNFSLRSINGKLPQVFVIQVQQIERVEDWTATAEKKFIEDAPTFGIQTHQFAINHCVLNFQLREVVPKV